MEMLKDNKEPPDDYWKNYDENDWSEPLSRSITTKKLVDGINLKDLCDGKEIIFEVSNEDVLDSEDENAEKITHCDLQSMREKRGAPVNCSFEELASTMTNVTEDGLVKKLVVTSGVGKVVPDNAYVTVHYNLYKESCTLPFDSTYLRNRPEKFRLDQGQTILGLEYAIKSMKKNENSKFFIKWEVAFGALGCPDRIEKKCDIIADITLINFVEMDLEEDLLNNSSEISKADFTQFIKQAKQLLCNGSDEFLKGDAKTAVISYRKALKILNNLRLADKEEEVIMLKEKVKCLVNLAVCYNKLGKPEQACLACQEVLSIDHNNIKANFHYGRANLSLSNFEIAEKYLFRAYKLKPNDEGINKEIKKLSDKKALFEMKDKIFWKRALENQDKEDIVKKDKTSPLESFEKNLKASLEESIKEDKPYVLPMPLLGTEMEVCGRVAAEMKMDFEKHPHFCIFKQMKK